MARQQVTLHIDDSSISVLECRGRQPQKWGIVHLDPGLVKEGVIQDQMAVANKIKELCRSTRIVRRKVTVGISGLNCLYQMLLLPELPQNLRSEAIGREAAHTLGIPLEGVYLSWQVLSVEHGQMKVYLTVMPKDKVDSVMATLKAANLRAVSMDIKPLCLARVSSEPRAIIVDTCQDAIDIVVLAEGIPEVVRSLQVAPEMSPGERIAVLRSELERSVSFFNAAHMDKPIDLTVPILVAGDLTGQDNDKASLAGPRERPVRNMESPLTETEDFDHGKFVTCIGLALKAVLLTEVGAVTHSVVNFNALPDVYQVRQKSLSELLWVPTVLVGVVIIGMGIWGIIYLEGQNSNLSNRLSRVNGMIEKQAVSDSDIATLTSQVNTAASTPTALTNLLANLKTSRTTVEEDLGVIFGDASSGVSLSNVVLGTKGFTLGGSATTEDGLFQYSKVLVDSGRFSSVMVTNISASDEGVSFTIVLQQG